MLGSMFGATKRARIAMAELRQKEKNLDVDMDEEVLSDDEGYDSNESETESVIAARIQRELLWKRRKESILAFFGLDLREDTKNDDAPSKPEDYYYNSNYHQDKNILIRLYLDWLAVPSAKISNNEDFNNLIVAVIIVAGINVGVQTYPGTDTIGFIVLDWLILVAFIVECVFKILAEGLKPHRYFFGPEWAWNQFDFAIVVLSLPMWDAVFSGGNSVAMLRLIRLARLGKLFKKIPPLFMIMKGLLGGLSSIAYILLLLFLVFYLYGIIGFYLYGESDPFHFGTLPLSLLILFRISLLDNWSDVMYVNIFGCDEYMNVYIPPEEETPHNSLYYCHNPKKHYYDAPIYFISFVVVSAFVMLSLFIGAITMSMSESMEELKRTQEEKKKQAQFEKNAKKMQKLARKVIDSETGLSKENSRTGSDMEREKSENQADEEEGELSFFESLLSCGHRDPMEEVEKIREYMKIALGNIKKNAGDDPSEVVDTETTPSGGGVVTDAEFMNKWYSPFLKYYLILGDYCFTVVEDPVFNNFMTFIIILAGINVGAQTDLRLQRVPELVQTSEILDSIILAFFTLEVCLKIIAFKQRPLHYFRDNWNNFDFLIVVGSFVPAVGSFVPVLRLLRLLRVLKLVKRLPQLNIIINALINGLSSIGYIGVILFLVFYIFAILGIILFQDNDPWHFGNLHLALVSLFRTATLDNVTATMFSSMYGCDIGGLADVYGEYPEQCTNPKNLPILTCAFYVIFVIIAAQVLLTLFIGVISTSMDEAREHKNQEILVDAGVRKYASQRGISDEQIEAFQKVFELLDLDGEGFISEAELKLGLQAIDIELTDDEIIEITEKVDPDDIGIDMVGMMKFIFMTPTYRDGAAAARLEYLLNLKRNKISRPKPMSAKIWAYVKKTFPMLSRDELETQHEAALVLQDLWRARQARISANKEIEARKQIGDISLSTSERAKKSNPLLMGGRLDDGEGSNR